MPSSSWSPGDPDRQGQRRGRMAGWRAPSGSSYRAPAPRETLAPSAPLLKQPHQATPSPGPRGGQGPRGVSWRLGHLAGRRGRDSNPSSSPRSPLAHPGLPRSPSDLRAQLNTGDRDDNFVTGGRRAAFLRVTWRAEPAGQPPRCHPSSVYKTSPLDQSHGAALQEGLYSRHRTRNPSPA